MGFNIEKKLLNEYDWTTEVWKPLRSGSTVAYTSVYIWQAYVHRVAKRDLDVKKSYQQQDGKKLKKICLKVDPDVKV